MRFASEFYSLRTLLALAALVCSARAGHSDETPSDEQPIPPALKQYKGREIAVTMHYEGAPWLTRESREREEECSTLIKALDVKPGQAICDMGCGNGFYTLKLAELVGETGQVIAVDIQQEMLRFLEERAKEAGIKNIKPVLGTLVDPKLQPASLDMILLVDVYHEFSHPEHMLKAMREALKPDGRMVLVEFRLEDRNVPIKLLHKMSKKQILKEIPPNGFKLIEQFDKLPWQHVMFFARDDSDLPEIKLSDKPERKRIGQVLGEDIYADQLKSKAGKGLGEELQQLFLAPLWQRYKEDHQAEIEPTKSEIKGATDYFQARHAKMLAEERPNLAKDLSRIEEQLKSEKLSPEDRKRLQSEAETLKKAGTPPGEVFARFWLPQQLLQQHLYRNFGGGRLLWQQFGVEAFDATHAWLQSEEKLGNLQIDNPEHRTLLFAYWTRDHGGFLWKPEDRPEETEEFVNPPWQKSVRREKERSSE